MDKKILILGGAGFVGSSIANQLYISGYSVCVCDNLSFGSKDNLLNDIWVRECDISELSTTFLNQFDVIVSAYCSNIIYSIDNPVETYLNNANKAIEVFSRFKNMIVYLSTSSIYGNTKHYPTYESEVPRTRNAYDTSKLIAESYLKARGEYIILRLSNVYGMVQNLSEYPGVIPRFISSKLDGEKAVIHGSGEDTRDYTYIDDVVRAVKSSIDSDIENEILNIGTGVETSLIELCELIGVEYSLSEERPIDGISRRCLNISEAKNKLDWKPFIDLKLGLGLTESWMRFQRSLKKS